MSGDLTRDSDRLIREGRALVRDNQSGGRHRMDGQPIGRGSAGLRRGHWKKKITRMILAVGAILVAAMGVGIIINGIGFAGIMLTALAIVVALGVFANYPKIKVPKRADLTRTTDAGQLVARTELWLESQRPALPPPAVRVVDDMGVQLDALGRQLEGIPANHPAAVETRKLVGEVLPEMVDSYRKIPAHLRREKRGDATPDEQLVDSLGKISREIDSVTRQLAEGSLDDLAIRTRYLDYKYGAAGEPSALPSPSAEPENT